MKAWEKPPRKRGKTITLFCFLAVALGLIGGLNRVLIGLIAGFQARLGLGIDESRIEAFVRLGVGLWCGITAILVMRPILKAIGREINPEKVEMEVLVKEGKVCGHCWCVFKDGDVVYIENGVFMCEEYASCMSDKDSRARVFRAKSTPATSLVEHAE